MWSQIAALARAQLLTARNHLPRTSTGTVLMFVFLLLWYGVFLCIGSILAVRIADASMLMLKELLTPAFLCIFLFWQIVPLLTLSGGWALELKKIQVYPVPTAALFGIETLLRLTSAPEMLLVLVGVVAGLCVRGPRLAGLLGIALFLLFNLFLQLGIRDLLLHSFKRRRLKEIFAIAFISLSLLPQLFLRSASLQQWWPSIWMHLHSVVYPWIEVAALNSGTARPFALAGLTMWAAGSLLFAYFAFRRGLADDETVAGGKGEGPKSNAQVGLSSLLLQIWSDPMAALIEKEIRSLVRMPRFRVIFGMSCIFGLLIFLPSSLGSFEYSNRFVQEHSFSLMNLYGLLLLSEILIFNIFGLDRMAAELYFAAPLDLAQVFKAKNTAAVFFVAAQNATILMVATVFHSPVTTRSLATGLLICAVALTILICVGNLTSVITPRAVDPSETFKKQSGTRVQIWLFAAAVGLFLLLGSAFFVEYAFQRSWTLFVVLLLELTGALIAYKFALKSALRRAYRGREEIIQSLSAGKSPIGMG
jgi:ABC-2 type transport system permease protein